MEVKPFLIATASAAGADTQSRACLAGAAGTTSATTSVRTAVLAAALGLAGLTDAIGSTGLSCSAGATSSAASVSTAVFATALRCAGSGASRETGASVFCFVAHRGLRS